MPTLTPADELALLRQIDADPTVIPPGATSRVLSYRNERLRWTKATEETAKGTVYLKSNRTPGINPYLRVERDAANQMRAIERTIRAELVQAQRTALPATALSLRAYARRRRTALSVVQRAINEGRLTKRSVGRNAKGQPCILDPAMADAEWAAHTRPRAGNNGVATPSKLALATQREREARAKLVELEYQERIGVLVNAVEVELQWSEIVVAIRTSLLGLPTRVRQRLPHLTPGDMNVIDTVVRETLTELAEHASGKSNDHGNAA